MVTWRTDLRTELITFSKCKKKQNPNQSKATVLQKKVEHREGNTRFFAQEKTHSECRCLHVDECRQTCVCVFGAQSSGPGIPRLLRCAVLDAVLSEVKGLSSHAHYAGNRKAKHCRRCRSALGVAGHRAKRISCLKSENKLKLSSPVSRKSYWGATSQSAASKSRPLLAMAPRSSTKKVCVWPLHRGCFSCSSESGCQASPSPLPPS